MVDVEYRIVEHDGGWAYKLGDVFSETFADRASAEAAAERVAAEHRIPGENETISWEDESGRWHDEVERGSARPNAYVARQRPGNGSARPAARGRGHAREELSLAQRQMQLQPLEILMLAALCGYGLAMLFRSRR